MKQDEIGQRLVAAFARAPDPRSRHGQRHPLPAVLTVATAAMLAGARRLCCLPARADQRPSNDALQYHQERTG
jgi:hypothetical protein